MSGSPGHGHGAAGEVQLSRTAARVVVALLVVCAVAVVTGAVLLWPARQTYDVPFPLQGAGGGVITTVAGAVTAQRVGPCGGSADTAGSVNTGRPYANPTAFYRCTRTTVDITSGPDAGRTTTLVVAPGPGSPELRVGDELRLARGTGAGGATRYDFADFARGFPLSLLAAVFALAVVVAARWRGLAALAGLGIAAAVLAGFVLPALLAKAVRSPRWSSATT